jgi:endonuclease G
MARRPAQSRTTGRPRRAAAAAPLTADEIIAVLRAKAQRWVRLPNVTSVGVGREIDRNGTLTGKLAIQVTVAEKLDDKQAISRKGWRALPDYVTAPDGRRIPVDVLERTYTPAHTIVEPTGARDAALAAPPARVLRRRRLEPLRPGISVSHIDGVAGTLGAIVFDKSTGAACILSNFHVLQGAAGRIRDRVVQPGPNDDGNVNANLVGEVLRSHVGLAGDCAVATITDRPFEASILELDVVPRQMARVEVDDVVVKSGRTTGVTRGIVTRVGVVVAHDYGGVIGTRQIGAFEIGPDPAADAAGRILSKEGDSGALWMIEENGAVTDIAAGLHFALDVSMSAAAEHALACPIHSVCERLDVTFVR